MKRFIFLSVLFLFIGTASFAQNVKPNKTQVEKKNVGTATVGKDKTTQTKKGNFPNKKVVTTRISVQANKKKK